MADFQSAFEDVLKWEGGLSDDPDDRGGLTKFGISQAAHPGVDIANLTLDQAREIYRKEYWIPSLAALINDQKVATKYFNFVVNMGLKRACRCLQLACGDCGHPTTSDGIPGHNTVYSANACDSHDLLECLRDRAREHYYRIVAADPSQTEFVRGWLNRVNA